MVDVNDDIAIKEEIKIEPNSNKYKKEKAEKEKKEIVPVVKGKVTKKKNLGRKVSNSLIGEEFKNVKSYVILDVLIPAVKKAISDIVTNGIDMLLYGESGRTKRSSNISHVSYSRMYDRDDRYRTRTTTRARTGYDFDDIILETRSEAEEVLNQLYEMLDQYQVVTIADLYDLVGVTRSYTDNKYGWTNLQGAEVVRVRDGFVIKLPRAYPID